MAGQGGDAVNPGAHGGIGRQIELRPTCPIRHYIQVGIGDRIGVTQQVVVGCQVLIDVSEARLQTRPENVAAFLRHAPVKEGREATFVQVA